MSHPAANRIAGLSTSARQLTAAMARAVLVVLGLLLAAVLVMAWAPQLVDPLLLALGL
jgi:hypothetical protein